MLNKVFVKTYSPTPFDEKEILRYAGYKGEVSPQIQEVLNECIKESENAFSYRVCFATLERETLMNKWEDCGKLFTERLRGAKYAVLFACTVGLEIDRLILKEENVSVTKALFLQAIGAERIESLCETFCREVEIGCEKKGYHAGARFSAGYGDFPLEKQKEMFSLLSPQKTIGLTLNESLLMSPTKSVTAIIPIGEKDCKATLGCESCEKKDCLYKR